MSRKVNAAAAGSSLQFGEHHLGHIHLTSLDYGRIQPLLVQDCVPNDKIKLDLETVVTSALNAAPIQGRSIMNIAAFYVPNRVVWDDSVAGSGWNNYITGVKNVNIPKFELNKVRQLINDLPSSSRDKTDAIAFHSGMGINPQLALVKKTGSEVQSLMGSLLPYRAYVRVWWDWYRNSNVIPDSQLSSYINRLSYTEDFETNYLLPKYACWSKDYLTNNLRSPSFDSETYDGSIPQVVGNTGVTTDFITDDSQPLGPVRVSYSAGSNDANLRVPYIDNGAYSNNTINAFRSANALQTWIEKKNILGGRIRDLLRGMFGSSVQPETLQMSEYLGSNSFPVNFEVQAATTFAKAESGSPNYTPFGNSNPLDGNINGQLSGKSTMTSNGLSNINYHVKEHGHLLVLAWLMPEPFMFQGLSPMWLRGIDGVSPSRFDFLTPEMVNTGFEPMYLYEACLPNVSFNNSTPNKWGNYSPFAALGYRGKYSSYTYNMDRIGGCFVDSRTKNSMRSWWLGRDLLREAGCVDANGDWISGKGGDDLMAGVNHDTIGETTPSTMQAYDDKFVVSRGDVDHFICQCKINLDMVRPIPSVAVPRIESVVAQPHEFGGTRL